MYNDFIGLISSPGDEQALEIEKRTIRKLYLDHDYDVVRYGLPSGAIKHSEVQKDIETLVSFYFKNGYGRWPAANITPRFRKHVALFRASLDLYEEFSTTKVFSKDEIYVRCLREGNSFTQFIKKARSTCLRGKTSETETDIEEEYFFEEYDGYNSIIDERYLIHWDDRDEIDDIKYAFIPTSGKDRRKDFAKMLDTFWEDFSLDDTNWVTEFDMIASLKNTKMYDPKMKKTHLMREFWTNDINLNDPYFAKRSVVLTSPGSTRDTGVGDPSTILKVKQLNALARCISERVPYSANAPGPVCNARLKRVLKKNLFLHLDFKKFGLTFPRTMLNEMIRKISESSGFDLSHLYIHQFYIEIDGEVYETERGTVLGWLDSINSLCVAVILHHLSKKEELNFDFVTFNDDVEISKRNASAPQETLELLRLAVIAELDSFDIPISMNKTYGSRASVFLERYAYYQKEYGLDMYKEQLTVAAYAKSLVTEFPWQAKLFFSAAEQWTKSDYATHRCISTCPVEFRDEEKTLPLWAGGWYIRRKNGLDYSMNDCDRLGLRLGMNLSKYVSPNYATKREKPTPNQQISNCLRQRAYTSYSSSMAAHILDLTETRKALNDDLDFLYHAAETRCDVYSGKNEVFSESVRRVVERHRQTFYEPG
jgi:hypothetical protein